jgi:hypothetical protein
MDLPLATGSPTTTRDEMNDYFYIPKKFVIIDLRL